VVRQRMNPPARAPHGNPGAPLDVVWASVERKTQANSTRVCSQWELLRLLPR
jgi:hypothetical protein